MYLLSIYFDEKTTNTLQNLINKVAKQTKNTFMTDHKVPPHITISAFNTEKEAEIISSLDKEIKNLKKGELSFVSIGTFNSQVIFLSVVLNHYLHSLSLSTHKAISQVENTTLSKLYLPLNWLPHTTIAKKLSEDELLTAFKTLQKHFTLLKGTVTKIGLSKTNPHQEIKAWTF